MCNTKCNKNKKYIYLIAIFFLVILIGSLFVCDYNDVYGRTTSQDLYNTDGEIGTIDTDKAAKDSKILDAIAHLIFWLAGLIEKLVSNIIVPAITGSEMFPWADRVIFNAVPFLDINFISPADGSLFRDINGGDTVIGKLIKNLYYTVFTLALSFLGVTVGVMSIKLILSSIASEKAKYKAAIMNWLLALILVFTIHYLISFAFWVNEKMVEVAVSMVKDQLNVNINIEAAEASQSTMQDSITDWVKGYYSGLVDSSMHCLQYTKGNKKNSRLIFPVTNPKKLPFEIANPPDNFYDYYKNYVKPNEPNGKITVYALTYGENILGKDCFTIRSIDDWEKMSTDKTIEAPEKQSGTPLHDEFIQNMYRFVSGNYHHGVNLKEDYLLAIAYNVAFVTYYERHAAYKKFLYEGGDSFVNNHLAKYWNIMQDYTNIYKRKDLSQLYIPDWNKTWGALTSDFISKGLEISSYVAKYVDDYYASNGGGGTNQNIFTGVAEYMKRAVYSGNLKLNRDGEITGEKFHPVPAVMYAIFVIQSLMYFISYAKRLFYIIALSLFAPVVIIYDFFIKSVSG